MRPGNKGRPSLKCGRCGTDLGPNPWKWNGSEHYTECGCWPPLKENKMIRLPTKEEKDQGDSGCPKGCLLGIPARHQLKVEAFTDFSR